MPRNLRWLSYIDQRENIAKALNIDISQINVKATTEEGLGFTGKGRNLFPKHLSTEGKELKNTGDPAVSPVLSKRLYCAFYKLLSFHLATWRLALLLCGLFLGKTYIFLIVLYHHLQYNSSPFKSFLWNSNSFLSVQPLTSQLIS